MLIQVFNWRRAMPTSYTDQIKNGIDFKTYALTCARAFGACMELRDEPNGGDIIPDVFLPNDYSLKGQKEALCEIQKLNSMTVEDCEYNAYKDWLTNETRRITRLNTRRQLLKNYEAMLSKVNAWTPPTPDHIELQNFMRSQIIDSISFDCYECKADETPTIKLSGKDWQYQRYQKLIKDLKYHELEYEQEVKRAKDKTAWIQALKSSL